MTCVYLELVAHGQFSIFLVQVLATGLETISHTAGCPSVW